MPNGVLWNGPCARIHRKPAYSLPVLNNPINVPVATTTENSAEGTRRSISITQEPEERNMSREIQKSSAKLVWKPPTNRRFDCSNLSLRRRWGDLQACTRRASRLGCLNGLIPAIDPSLVCHRCLGFRPKFGIYRNARGTFVAASRSLAQSVVCRRVFTQCFNKAKHGAFSYVDRRREPAIEVRYRINPQGLHFTSGSFDLVR